jgi:tetratricopeptide (TPR) repeat protein
MRHVPWPFFLRLYTPRRRGSVLRSRAPASRAASIVVALLTFTLALASLQARAQEALDDERARAHFVAGESHFAAERWNDAEREFSLAYELSHRPEMLINLARAHERNGELVAAIADLELLLSAHPETSYRGEALQRLTTMRAKLAAVTPPAANTPAPARAPLPSFRAVPEPVRARDRGVWPPSLPTLVVGGVAIAAGVVALATGLRAHGIYHDLEKRCDASGACDPPFAGDRDHGRALSRSSTALTFASVALVGAAAVMWVIDEKKSDGRGDLAFGFDAAGARLRARF